MSETPLGIPARRFSWSSFFENFGALLALVILFGFNAAFSEGFLKPENLRNIIHQNAVVGIVAVGMTFVIVAGGIDLSVGSMLALVGGLTVLMLNWLIGSGVAESLAVVGACIIAIITGTALGYANGFLITRGRIAPFIATLGGLVAYRSIVLAMADGGEIRSASTTLFPSLAGSRSGIPLPFIQITPDRPLVLTWLILAFVVVAVAGHILLARTRFGRYVIAVGCNETAARYSAINVNRIRTATYTLLGACTGLAALLSASRLNSVGSSNAGMLLELDAIAAVAIGGTRMEGGRGRIWCTVVGVLTLGIINTMINFLNVSPHWQGAVKGVVIIAAVLVQRTRRED